jgi:(2R)-sulfolactate sulfo-lyase subunit beta
MISEVCGWRRANGRLGIRNHVAVLSADAASDPACAAIVAAAPDAVLVPSSYSWAEDECEDAATLRPRILAGICANPNVAAAIIVGSDGALLDRVSAGIAATGKPVERFLVSAMSVEAAAERARNLLGWAGGLPKETAPLSEVWIAAKCDESDATTGSAACPAMGAVYDALIPFGAYGVFGETPELSAGADEVAARAANAAAAAKWLRARDRHEARLRESGDPHPQPTAANIAGGIPTAHAKAMSSLAKIGRHCRYLDVLGPGEAPAVGPGLYYMDTSSELAAIALMAAAGFVMNVLPSGYVSHVGDPIVPVLQVNANPATVRASGELIDLDLTDLHRGEIDLVEAGGRLIELIRRTADGAPTASERRRS